MQAFGREQPLKLPQGLRIEAHGHQHGPALLVGAAGDAAVAIEPCQGFAVLGLQLGLELHEPL